MKNILTYFSQTSQSRVNSLGEPYNFVTMRKNLTTAMDLSLNVQEWHTVSEDLGNLSAYRVPRQSRNHPPRTLTRGI